MKMEELIATGGTGEVYSIGNGVVRKIFKMDIHKKEFDILSRLNLVSSKYFPQIIDYSPTGKYIDMSYCGEIINENNVPSGWLDQIVKIAKIFDKCGVLHFDIKQENILVHNNEIKIIDFEKSVIEKWYLHNTNDAEPFNFENECIYLDDRIKFYDVIWAKNKQREKIPYGDIQVTQQTHKKRYDNLKYLRKTCLGVLSNAAV